MVREPTRAAGIASLPDETKVYVPGVGEVTLGEIREAARPEAVEDPLEPTLRMWEDIATRNLLREPGQEYVSTARIKSLHAVRCLAD